MQNRLPTPFGYIRALPSTFFIDKQGRILVSSVLRTNAGLNSEVVLIGLGNRIELWDRNECDSIVDPQKINKEAMMEEFSKLDL